MNTHSIEDLGCISNLEVINRFVNLKDQFVIDAGCGDLTVSKLLHSAGANVLAIDPDPIQAEKNRAAPTIDGIEFVETGADLLPAEDESVDGVFFSYSLHHIPESKYPEVFDEVYRVLKPDGYLYVIEPTDCPLNQVMLNFHDEEAEREAAQRFLKEHAAPHFEESRLVTYHDIRQYKSFDEFATIIASRSFNSLYSEEDVRHPKVQAAFEKAGAPDYTFTAPKLVMYCQGLKR